VELNREDLMQIVEQAGTIIFVAGVSPDAVFEQELGACGLRLQWAADIDAAAGLVKASAGTTVLVSELALKDGNWMDLVERTRRLGRPVPLVLVSSIVTAELWWDALEFGVEDILAAPLSAPRLRRLLSARFAMPT
jgi:DNA-binding NtrC family response regulator